MVVPQGPWRPVITGWFAEFAELSAPTTGAVGYAKTGMSFWGATMEPTGWYRFNAVWDQFSALGISVATIHAHVCDLQKTFLAGDLGILKDLKTLYKLPLNDHGHFLTFEAPSAEKASFIRETLLKQQVYVDQRGARLRFGFGLYQDKTDVAALLRRLNRPN